MKKKEEKYLNIDVFQNDTPCPHEDYFYWFYWYRSCNAVLDDRCQFILCDHKKGAVNINNGQQLKQRPTLYFTCVAALNSSLVSMEEQVRCGAEKDVNTKHKKTLEARLSESNEVILFTGSYWP